MHNRQCKLDQTGKTLHVIQIIKQKRLEAVEHIHACKDSQVKHIAKEMSTQQTQCTSVRPQEKQLPKEDGINWKHIQLHSIKHILGQQRRL